MHSEAQLCCWAQTDTAGGLARGSDLSEEATAIDQVTDDNALDQGADGRGVKNFNTVIWGEGRNIRFGDGSDVKFGERG